MSDEVIEIDGYVVAFRPDQHDILWEPACTGTFDFNPVNSWIRLIGSDRYFNLSFGDRSYLIQRYFDAGFRLKKAKLVIDNSDKE